MCYTVEMKNRLAVLLATLVLCGSLVMAEPVGETWPNYTGANPKIINFPSGFEAADAGGNVLVANIDNDDLMEFIVTSHSGILAFDWDGTLLWRNRLRPRFRVSASRGKNLPGSNHPAFAVIGKVGALIEESTGDLVIVNLKNGNRKKRIDVGSGAQVVMAAELRPGRRTVVVQYNQVKAAAYDIDTGRRLWRTSNLLGFDHGPVFAGDLDLDGFDETLGVYSVDKNGIPLPRPPYPGGFNPKDVDSVAFGDLNGDGLIDMVLAEQAGLNRTWAITPSTGEILWSNDTHPPENSNQCRPGRETDPDKVVIGNFIPSSPGLEVLARSACGKWPWIMSATGKTLVKPFNIMTLLPDDWEDNGNEGGIDIISPLRWFGKVDVLVFKRRHKNEDVAMVRFAGKKGPRRTKLIQANVIYPLAVDVAGDHREELVLLEKTRLRIFFHNKARRLRPRLWESDVYRHRKQTSMYYSTS